MAKPLETLARYKKSAPGNCHQIGHFEKRNEQTDVYGISSGAPSLFTLATMATSIQ